MGIVAADRSQMQIHANLLPLRVGGVQKIRAYKRFLAYV